MSCCALAEPASVGSSQRYRRKLPYRTFCWYCTKTFLWLTMNLTMVIKSTNKWWARSIGLGAPHRVIPRRLRTLTHAHTRVVTHIYDPSQVQNCQKCIIEIFIFSFFQICLLFYLCLFLYELGSWQLWVDVYLFHSTRHRRRSFHCVVNTVMCANIFYLHFTKLIYLKFLYF